MPARDPAESKRSARIRPTALPPEHGSWGLVSEPLALGLLLAPSAAGACIAVGAFATFLTRRPLKVLLGEWKREHSQRFGLALSFVALYVAIAALGFAGSVLLAGARPLLPLLLAGPLMLVFLVYDFRNQSRTWQAELAGAGVFAIVAASAVLAGGWRTVPAFVVAGVWVARSVSSILYVRNRIRLDRGRPYDTTTVVGVHAAALVLTCGLAGVDLLPWLGVIPFVVLLGRAAIGLSRYRRRTTVRAIGLTEMGYGILTMLGLVAGYWTQVP